MYNFALKTEHYNKTEAILRKYHTSTDYKPQMKAAVERLASEHDSLEKELGLK